MTGFDSALGFASYPFYSLFRLTAILLILPAALCLGSFFAHPRALIACGIVGALGTGLLLSGQEPLGGAPLIIGTAIATLCSQVLWLACLESLATESFAHTRRILIASAFITLFAVPAWNMSATVVIYASGILLAFCAPLLAAGRTRPSPEPKLTAAHQGMRTLTYPKPVIVVFFAIALSFGFSQSLLYSVAPQGSAAIVILAKAVGLAAFAALAYLFEDNDYASLFKLVATVAMVSFALMLYGGVSTVPFAIMATAHAAFELASTLAIVNLASYAQTRPLLVFCAFKGVDYAALSLGGLVAELAARTSSLFSLYALIICLVMGIAAIWACSNRTFIEFFWGTESPSASSTADSYDASISATAQSRGLSPRETEVLRMYALGRSAVYIAESLSIGTTTVHTHIRHIYEKCGVHSRQELITLVSAGSLGHRDTPA